MRVVDAGYFQALGIPLLRGRTFSDLELKEAKRVILINDALARKHFPNQDPIGQRLDFAMFENPVVTEIIGVVGNVRYDSLIDEAPPAVYFPHLRRRLRRSRCCSSLFRCSPVTCRPGARCESIR